MHLLSTYGYNLDEYEKQLRKATTLHDKFKDQNKRNEQRRKIRKTWQDRKDNGETVTGIEVSQKDSYSDYMREYQRQWRQKPENKNYYRDLQRKKRERLKKKEIEAEDFFEALIKLGEKNEK